MTVCILERMSNASRKAAPTAPTPPPLMPLRSLVIIVVAVAASLVVAKILISANESWWNVASASGATFAGVVTFLDKHIGP